MFMFFKYMFLHVLTCFNIFYHGLTHVNQQTCRIYSPTTWSFRYIMVHHGWCEKMGIAKTPWRTSASNICSFALPAGAVLSGAFPISDPLQPKKHHELLVSIYEHCYVNWYVNCFVNCGVSVSPHTSQRSCYTVLK